MGMQALDPGAGPTHPARGAVAGMPDRDGTVALRGVPGMSVPAGLDANGLPLGLQVIGKPFDEETVFSVAAAVERAAKFDALPALRAGG